MFYFLPDKTLKTYTELIKIDSVGNNFVLDSKMSMHQEINIIFLTEQICGYRFHLG